MLLKLLLLCFALTLTGCGTPKNNLVTPDHTGTNYVVAPAAANAIQIGKEVSTFLPSPFGEIAGTLLLGASSLLGVYARRKSAEAVKAQRINQAMVLGVESAADTGQPVKAIIKNYAETFGVQPDLHAIVKETTK